ncbi:MAG: bacteriohemerythrin [Magnetovibrionaceae bacterium]
MPSLLRLLRSVVFAGTLSFAIWPACAVKANPTFQDVFDKHNSVMLLIDPQTGSIADANPAAAAFYGYSRDDLRTMFIQNINQLTAEQVKEERQLAKSEGRNFFIFRHQLANGDIRTVEVKSVPFTFDGRVLLHSIIRDISRERSIANELWHYQSRLEDMVQQQTEEIRKKTDILVVILGSGALVLSVFVLLLLLSLRRHHQAERLLLENREHYRSMVNGLEAHFLYKHDTEGVFTYVSPSITPLLGYSEQEFLTSFETYLTDSPLNHACIKHTEGSIRGEQQPPYIVEIFHKDGSIRTLEVLERPVRDLDQRVVAVEGIAQDITERKQAEAMILQAKDDAEKANKTKSQFLASMSHELRTPLNAVLGFAQLLQFDVRYPLNAVQNEHVESILSGGRHLLGLVDEILELSKIEADQLTITLEEVSAREVIRDSIALASSLSVERNVEIIDNTEETLSAALRTDRTRLKQVLVNLLSNAIKFNDDGGTVMIDSEELPNGYLRIAVADTGIGIAPEDKENVFQLFHRLDADPGVAREGTGIGLTITKSILEHMAGSINFSSEVNKGTKFWVEIPLFSNDDVMIWTESMVTGVDAIDSDHKVLMGLLNRISKSSVDSDGIDDIVSELVEYTSYHFSREEAIMEICEYPGLEDHLEIHKSIRAQVAGLADKWREDKGEDALSNLHKFMQDWLYSHIIHEDTKIEGHAKGKKREIKHALETLTFLAEDRVA